MSSSESNLSRAARYAVPFALVLIPVWRAKVNAEVPEPYLDEVFHVPQAQAYWAHQWTHWDPKLTTPPGLYLWSYLLCAVLLAIRGSPTKLDTEALRATNVATTAVFLPWRLQALSDAVHSVRNSRQAGAWISHTVLNICLFPPLFFFSGLYYTDILALLAVVEAYNWDLKLASRKGYTVVSTFGFLVFGLAALVCRQTNIFWVAVFLGGLQVVRTIRSHSKTLQSSDLPSVFEGGMRGHIYDPLVSEASLGDYFKAAISFAVSSLRHPITVVGYLLPHIIILGAFGAFVLWNDGVVLGHKEFHTAGIHLAQMLYIWPYFVFFSWPILIIPVLNLVLPRSVLPKSLNYGFPEKQKKLPGILACLIVLPTMLAIVHFNTIVHPFTLADNRHYVFYVFRLLLGVHPTIKYAAVVVYFLCGWSVISAFGFSTPQFLQVPATKPTHATKPTEKEVPKETRKQTRAKAKAAPQNGNQQPEQKPQPPKIQPISPEAFERMRETLAQRKAQEKETRVSFVLVWIAATALSLVTAPLVEPRYFIIPWVMWRLHLPPSPTPAALRKRFANEGEKFRADVATNFPKFLETVWFILINVVTGYVFLYKGFEWPQEPGKIQRFMW
ncbi:Dol-P-Glc:Glc(2)Man(9)GlcNAc(2)-PP-Dol alpha-1-2-glucosyltransferase [Penicillium atrosanguineum]|uniref:Dol-P-Glc:Glc(2)Man(9)GlcNAc(2)-PP-Dol alpha-1,2-glucosyltransferase n=1 Tax=Penicillium atrosanguineum TaxID=1132637 RepID=A0A9W9Q7W3_9EURO|nr:enoyl-CoA hydratase [Penicillium atrosanguineum]KAJ5150044.1 Dol-P-Glc:Glc(2)Man(9)GlcNAc(2)-PP-Dol alpha-1-2-glucosyltransferase [Penicillium atrosanguineum]KAJ5305360.1 enoyl-CoA hydratase [Penicillium atrosanguineum]KAJ5324822.1 Dol-P-Glc:Glc(2)Man(9)GlcNAc(2)-PP-Dol alpha-1-2-glucosyltransferase [Penicillium atrosanguineum]